MAWLAAHRAAGGRVENRRWCRRARWHCARLIGIASASLRAFLQRRFWWVPARSRRKCWCRLHRTSRPSHAGKVLATSCGCWPHHAGAPFEHRRGSFSDGARVPISALLMAVLIVVLWRARRKRHPHGSFGYYARTMLAAWHRVATSVLRRRFLPGDDVLGFQTFWTACLCCWCMNSALAKV